MTLGWPSTVRMSLAPAYVASARSLSSTACCSFVTAVSICASVCSTCARRSSRLYETYSSAWASATNAAKFGSVAVKKTSMKYDLGTGTIRRRPR